MKLVLAEKPSVAQSIAKVLGAAKREDGYEAGIEDIGTAGAVRCKIDLRSWKSAYKHCVLCDWHTAFGYWRFCDLLHCKGFMAVPAYPCGSWNCDNSSGVPARLDCYESREYWRKSGSIYQVIR